MWTFIHSVLLLVCRPDKYTLPSVFCGRFRVWCQRGVKQLFYEHPGCMTSYLLIWQSPHTLKSKKTPNSPIKSFTECSLILLWQTPPVPHLTQLLEKPPAATSHITSSPPRTTTTPWSHLHTSGSMQGKEPPATPPPGSSSSPRPSGFFRRRRLRPLWAQTDGAPTTWIRTCWPPWPRALFCCRSAVRPASATPTNQTRCPSFTSTLGLMLLSDHPAGHR